MLSLQLSCKIFFWIIDDHIIHVEFEFHFREREKMKLFRLFRYVCICSLSKVEIYELYAQHIIVKSNIDWHMRISKEKHSSKLHDECYLLFENFIQHENCFALWYMSRETHRKTRRLLFATTKWFIDNSYVSKKWFIVIFRDFLFTIRHLHLDMHMKSNFSNNSNITIARKIAIFELIFTKLFDFQILNVFIHVDEHITFWIQSIETNFENMLLFLKRLNILQNLTIVVHDSFSTDHEKYCQQRIYDYNIHDYHENWHARQLTKRSCQYNNKYYFFWFFINKSLTSRQNKILKSMQIKNLQFTNQILQLFIVVYFLLNQSMKSIVKIWWWNTKIQTIQNISRLT